MKIIAIIPARYGSTRFAGKPLAAIAGKPMIQHVYENATRSGKVSGVVVATDDRRIHDAVVKFNGNAIMTSPDHRSGTDRVAEAAEKLGMHPDDIVINVQGDQPLVHPDCFEAVVAPLLEKPAADMSTLAFAIQDQREFTSPKDCKVVLDQDGFALYFSRSPIPFSRDGDHFEAYKHLGVYGYTRRFLEIFRHLPTGRLEQIEKLEQLRALEYGHSISVVVTPFDSPEVDLPSDIDRIEAILRK
ncbi:MAG: 3-deoxy-manno-octulosonate cytidylyltransferase [Desulfobacteraceae bacterium]|nr:MAG: 3-deoxy-manno-octulosonate cytidylyltransferase [Desulfobacteraceae bacterium]